jgi:hypothetical protein
VDPTPSTPAEAAKHIRTESEKWGIVVRNAKIRADS